MSVMQPEMKKHCVLQVGVSLPFRRLWRETLQESINGSFTLDKTIFIGQINCEI